MAKDRVGNWRNPLGKGTLSPTKNKQVTGPLVPERKETDPPHHTGRRADKGTLAPKRTEAQTD